MKGWAVIGALWWLALAILWLSRKHRRKLHRATHHELRMSGRTQLDAEIDPQTYSDSMLRAALSCFGYVLGLAVLVFGIWLAITLVGAH